VAAREDLVVKIAGNVIGSEWRNVTPADIAGEFDLQIVPGSAALPNRDVLRSQGMRMFELWQQSPWVDQRELHLMMGENFPELMAGGRLDRLIKNPEQARKTIQGLQGGGEQPPLEEPGMAPVLNLPVG
jgi:hypothetical protein